MKKIMFNDKYCLTQAVLGGTKTMTRRVERLKPSARMFDEALNIEGGLNDKGRWIFTLYNKNGDIIGDIIPHYNISEVVAIAQPYKDLYSHDDVRVKFNPFFDMTKSTAWNNKLFVESQYMKHHIRITDVKVERLQDISDEDCMSEGLKFRYTNMNFGNMLTREDYYYDYLDKYGEINGYGTSSPRKTFSIFIDKICGYGTWENNLLVVAYSFELVD